MADGINIVNGEPKPVVQIVITQLDNGQTIVNAPLNNKILAYGLLEIAREIIANHKPGTPEIIPARFKLS